MTEPTEFQRFMEGTAPHLNRPIIELCDLADDWVAQNRKKAANLKRVLRESRRADDIEGAALIVENLSNTLRALATGTIV